MSNLSNKAWASSSVKDDRYFFSIERRDRVNAASQLSRDFCATTRRCASRITVFRRLDERVKYFLFAFCSILRAELSAWNSEKIIEFRSQNNYLSFSSLINPSLTCDIWDHRVRWLHTPPCLSKSMTVMRYVELVLKQQSHLFWDAVAPDFISINEKTRQLWSHLVHYFLEI